MSEPTGDWKPNGLCSLFACDIASFGDPSRSDLDRQSVRRALYRGLRASFDGEGIGLPACYREDRGDGALVAVPPTIDTARLLSSLADRLRAEVRRHNDVSSATARMQLRLAVHTGVAHSDDDGLVGTAVNHLFRLLEADQLRRALRGTGAELALITSARVHEDVVQHGLGMVDPGEYVRIDVRVKETVTPAWIRIPGLRSSIRPVPDAPRAVTTARVVPPAEPTLPGPPPPPAITVVERPSPLETVLDLAMAVRQLRGRRSRDQIVAELPLAVATSVRERRADDDRTDMSAIVSTCRAHPQGLRELVRAVRQFAGDSPQVADFTRSVEALRQA
ncbi:hypothetical protein [Actinomadura sp. GTD37]|uniref:effector-associated domain 2-containing protein n=1 Tax=Actinomadura sp. GTD37 TaxID=1778030 RepID=UPI0035C24EA6